ncbi:MAG: DUF805 domain-containing protein [Rhodospirillales bacterium]|nr:DUF805 domain-containing protein [Rhodospirillales bacterium]
MYQGFAAAVSTCFRKYAVFGGRASRAEFWWFVLFSLLSYLAVAIVGGILAGLRGRQLLSLLWWLVLFLPYISVEVRRLHDIGRSGWWWWLGLVPLIGGIVLLVWACTAGTPGPNRFGDPEPLPA